MPDRHAARRGLADQEGQASAELIAVLPVLLAAALIAAQLALAGHALWSSAIAARAGARAAHVGGEAVATARRALPPGLRRDAEIEERDDGVQVRVVSPRLLSWLPRVPVAARAALEPGGA